MNNKFVSIVIDKEEGSRFLVSDDRSIDTVDLSKIVSFITKDVDEDGIEYALQHFNIV